MSEFKASTEMFGKYVKISTDYSCKEHLYKVVGELHSNTYCDTPIMCNSKPQLHKKGVPILRVIHCGIDEEEVIRVALSDCKIVDM